MQTKEEHYRSMILAVQRYAPNADMDLIERAYRYADGKHKDQPRKSGEPYIIHPLAVAEIVAEIGLDSDAIAAALLHDCLEDLISLMSQPSPPTAIFSTNYDITVGLITAARERGVKIPDEVSVFGFDCAEICRMMTPPIPVVQQPEQELGRLAGMRLIERMSGSRDPARITRLPCRLIE